MGSPFDSHDLIMMHSCLNTRSTLAVFTCTLRVSAHPAGCNGEEQEDGGEAGCGFDRTMHEAAVLP